MDRLSSLRLAEALTSHLCHELVNPIGAVGNGVEILREDPAFAVEAAAMVSLSIRQASRRVQFYRFAYGSTSEPGEEAARNATTEMFEGSKIICNWPAFMVALPPGWTKLVMNLVMVAAECIPRGGRITVAEPPRDKSTLAIHVEGQAIRIPDQMPELLLPDVPIEKIVPRAVQAIFAAALAARLGFHIRISDPVNNHATFSLHVS